MERFFMLNTHSIKFAVVYLCLRAGSIILLHLVEMRRYFLTTFDGRGIYTFQTLSALCDLINRTISNSLTDFYSSEYVGAFVTPTELFQSQAQSLILQLISTTTNEFLLSIDMIRGTTQSNALFSALFTNYYFYVRKRNVYAIGYSEYYGNCTCTFSAACVEQYPIYDSNDKVLFTVPGMYTGCYVIESLLQSTLQCFYDQTCINQLQSYFLSSSTMYITALDSSLPTQYFINSTIEDLLDHLMVEQWNSSHMYENYYNACHPAQCTYTHQAKNNIIYIVTTLIGLVGGLITVLKLLVPQLVKFIRRKTELPGPENGKIKKKIFGNIISSEHYVRIEMIFH